MKRILSLIMVLNLVSLNLQADDLVGEKHSIEVTHYENGNIGFAHCEENDEQKECHQLGRKKSYTREHLKKVQTHVKNEFGIQIGKTTLAAAAGVALGALIGVIAMAVTASTAAVGVTTAITGTGATALAVAGKEGLVRKYRANDLMDDDFLADKDIKMTDKQVKKFADILDTVLRAKPESLGKMLTKELLGLLGAVADAVIE
jgi:hypothetical protein